MEKPKSKKPYKKPYKKSYKKPYTKPGRDSFKTDSEYGYSANLLNNRNLPEGHNMFNFYGKYTEVEILKEILDKYMDTSTMEKSCELSDYKMDFGISFIDTMIIILTAKLTETSKYLSNVEKQIQDINHRMLKPSLSGKVMTKEEKLEIYDLHEESLLYRRKLKDTISIQKVTIENLEKTRNFILAMNQRMYHPKSDKFQDDENFFIDKAVVTAESDVTRVKTVDKEK